MKIRINKREQQIESSWSGGRTLELAIFPEDTKYLDRDFIWRLSTADSDREESSFTKLPDYDRILMVLEGDVVLAHGTERSVHLQSMEQDSFDGAIKTKCFGRLIKDYNLIMAKGCRGAMRAVELSPEAVSLRELMRAGREETEAGQDSAADEKSGSAITAAEWEAVLAAGANSWSSFGFFCLDGYAVISCGGRSEMIRPGEQAVIDLLPEESPEISFMGEGRGVLTAVNFAAGDAGANGDPAGAGDAGTATGAAGSSGAGLEAGASGAAGIAATAASAAGQAAEPAKTSFAKDYGTMMGLFLQNNKWSKMMRREGRGRMYHDRILTERLARLERRFVTTIVWAAGALLCFVPMFITGGHVLGSIIAAAVFTVFHLLLLGPFIYWKYLPNPIASHMKNVEEMSAIETMQHARDIAENPRLDKLMRKYRSDDENYFTDDSSPLSRLVIREKDQKQDGGNR